MEIIRLLANYVNMYPDMRLGQALQALEIVQQEEVEGQIYLEDNYYEESVITLERVKKIMAGNL